MNLSQYWGKQIRVTFNDDQVLEGYAKSYTSRENSDNNQEELILETDNDPYIGFNETELKKIEIIE